MIELVGRTGKYSQKGETLRMAIPDTAVALQQMDKTLIVEEIKEAQLQVMHDLIERCWLEDWRSRPSIDDVVAALQQPIITLYLS